MVDDDLLNGTNGFLFKEIISDFSLKQCEDLSLEHPATVLAASNGFITEKTETLRQIPDKKIFIFGDKAVTSYLYEACIEHIDNDDIPLSQSEWREKIITTDKTVVVKNSKFIDKLARVVSDAKLPMRFKRKILSRIPMSIEKLEKEIERDIIFISFSTVKFIGNRKVSNRLVKKCLLSGIRVEGIPVCRSELQSDTERAVKVFKEKIFQYI
ncbi:hypothetical protein [Vibrio sp. V11_P1A41T118]|nr:hypothetical protein [Vibrio sp. V11_P1A41T118]